MNIRYLVSVGAAHRFADDPWELQTIVLECLGLGAQPQEIRVQVEERHGTRTDHVVEQGCPGGSCTGRLHLAGPGNPEAWY